MEHNTDHISCQDGQTGCGRPEYPEIRKEIQEYVYGRIVPEYARFDLAHRQDHALAVIDNSMELYRTAPEELRNDVNPEMLFVAAACHDLGRINGKENHHIDSGRIIRADKELDRWFNAARLRELRTLLADHDAARAAVSAALSEILEKV